MQRTSGLCQNTKWAQKKIVVESHAKDIKYHISNCITCSNNLPNISCHPQLHLEIPKVPFTCIAIDTIGKLPTTSSGNSYAQGNSRIENVHNFLQRTLTKFLSSSDAKWDRVLLFACYCFNSTPTSDDLESPFLLILGRDPLEGHAGLVSSGDTRYMGNEKGLILFTKLRKLWLMHAKSLQENKLLKADTLECSKNFKPHHFKVGQLIAVKNHLKSMFEPKFMSDYRILNIINECTLLIQSSDGKTRKINIKDAKPVSAITAADNTLQDFKKSILRRECTHPYNLCSSSM